ncbi:MAG: hypothetical protein ACYDA1_05260 [Vulcanimicrobiaceae bacterium]
MIVDKKNYIRLFFASVSFVLLAHSIAIAATLRPTPGLPRATYKAQCSISASGVGYSVPGFGVGIKYAIINEYPVEYSVGDDASNNGALLGFVYTTWGRGNGVGGSAYFVGSNTGTDPMINGATSIFLGPNELVQNLQNLSELVRSKLVKLAHRNLQASIKKSHVDGPCFSKNWNGSY